MEPTEYTITLTLAETALVGQALGVQPHNAVRELIDKLNAQIDEQQRKFVDEQLKFAQWRQQNT